MSAAGSIEKAQEQPKLVRINQLGKYKSVKDMDAAGILQGVGPALSSGARNEVSIITPTASSEGVLTYLSIVPLFLGGIIMTTAGALIEVNRFFPDSLYW